MRRRVAFSRLRTTESFRSASIYTKNGRKQGYGERPRSDNKIAWAQREKSKHVVFSDTPSRFYGYSIEIGEHRVGLMLRIYGENTPISLRKPSILLAVVFLLSIVLTHERDTLMLYFRGHTFPVYNARTHGGDGSVQLLQISTREESSHV
ncbi:hypothetical protein TGME49_286525 [Toxoplasma gondii ME49]|uniref:Uncharacterized protein n=1 Tax=Toxoplasma gondii (strain ATCC 50611 / Me49) TaxID=508771 RepID=S8F5C4_TOXGM|nr:hypothetical protein TGME49_286525 [Toxoplasma gondii ME49]EPT31016.1 hypothetical protein TGME49_286525 [Toxoplasma gondii ME49]|eukprot:XP_018637781.1 hypothetical protein TGME49_286525 [Toxoplasma gondii ME49]